MNPTRILFVCHGNICRSAMAQHYLQHLVNQQGVSERYVIDSAATTTEQLGESIYPPARKKLVAEGIPLLEHRARQIGRGEWAEWDYIVCMDEENVQHLTRILGREHMGKVRKLLSYVGEAGDVADPWYTGNFDATYRDVDRGCRALLEEVES